MSVSQEERARRLADGVRVICGERSATDGFKSCTECRTRMRDLMREREERAKKIKELEREMRRREREEIAKERMCGACGYKRYAGDHVYTCPSAFGTCIKAPETYGVGSGSSGLESEGFAWAGRACETSQRRDCNQEEVRAAQKAAVEKQLEEERAKQAEAEERPQSDIE